MRRFITSPWLRGTVGLVLDFMRNLDELTRRRPFKVSNGGTPLTKLFT